MISAVLRPTASAIRPPMKAPKNSPSGLPAITLPSMPGDRWNSGPSLGAAMPMDCRSTPSMKVAQKQRIRVAQAAAGIPAFAPSPAVLATPAMSPPLGFVLGPTMHAGAAFA